MKSKINKFLVVLAVFALVAANAGLSFAETMDQDAFLNRLKQELNLTKTDYRQMLGNISDTQKRIELLREERMTLSQQLSNLDNQIAFSNKKLFDVIAQIVQKENEIALLYEEIEVKETAFNYQKSLMEDYVRVIYEEENAYFTLDGGQINAFKLLLADGSVGDNLRELDYLDMLNEAGQQMLDKLEGLSSDLDAQKFELGKGLQKLDVLKIQLELEKNQLELQKESKEQLLRTTSGQEEVYQQLLEQTVAQQEDVLSDLKNLHDAVTFIEQKIAEEGANFDPQNYLSLLDFKTKALYKFEFDTVGLDPGKLIWPVDPDRGLSAFFRDPGYAGVFGVQHSAVDIPEYQGSPVRAAADAVVYTAKDNGYGYNYIILAHAGGLMSVYGHVSEILVEEGQMVPQGTIIALSGGMPGTLGAGYMTTGPHLHFETLLNGNHVDPLNYLPLEVLTEEQVEWLPEKYHEAWDAAVLRTKKGPVERF